LPPLSINTCAPFAATTPFAAAATTADVAVDTIFKTLSGSVPRFSDLKNDASTKFDAFNNQTPPAEQLSHASLMGVNFAAHQSEPADCWAATLETARAFLHLPQVSQDQILRDAKTICPKLNYQRFGASMNQIAQTINYLEATYDKGNPVHPDFCTKPECIIESLQHRQPVIMLYSGRYADHGHAVLIVGLDYAVTNVQGKTAIIPYTFHILDPVNQNETTHTPVPETTSAMYAACRADAFISY
jgi:hypothetical protein